MKISSYVQRKRSFGARVGSFDGGRGGLFGHHVPLHEGFGPTQFASALVHHAESE